MTKPPPLQTGIGLRQPHYARVLGELPQLGFLEVHSENFFHDGGAALLFFVAGMAVKSHRRPVVSGREELLGSTGEVIAIEGQEGWARVHGENWRVRSARPIQRGGTVRVVGVQGLTLDVEPAEPSKTGG